MTLTLRPIFLLALVLSVGHGQYSMAADGLSFNPTSITITSQGTIPVGTVIPWPSTSLPTDATRWLECNGQAVPPGSQYDRLRAIVGTNVPNYGDQFLRGTTTPSLVGTKVSDSIRSHTVYVPGQNAPVSGNLNSTGLSGNASAQYYSYVQMDFTNAPILTSAPNATVGSYTFGTGQNGVGGWTGGGSISGALNSGSLTGTAYVSSQTGTYAGGSETAPLHTRVRYLIRAVP